jgi:hypothetical protein
MTTDAHLCKRNTHGNDDERIILGHVETGSQHKIQLYRAVRTRVLAHAQSGRRKEVWLAMAMKLRLRVLLLFGITGLLTLLLVLYLYTRPSDELLGPEDIPGPDRILGSILTHILKPELSQRVEVAEADSDPGILVSVKTTTRYHQHRLSLLLFTWMKTLPPEQLYIVTDRKANDPWIREAKLAGIYTIVATLYVDVRYKIIIVFMLQASMLLKLAVLKDIPGMGSGIRCKLTSWVSHIATYVCLLLLVVTSEYIIIVNVLLAI